MDLRVGLGYDLHRLAPGRPLKLGGVAIPFDRGLLGHSDGDCLLHAIADALLGAAGLSDIGELFPDTDEANRGADSAELLGKVAARVREAGFEIVNVDAVLIADAPRIAPHKTALRGRIAEVLAVDVGRVNLKAKTTEGVGPPGEAEAIAAHAVVLLNRIEDAGLP